MSKKQCNKCGKRTAQTSSFCPACGSNELDLASADATPATFPALNAKTAAELVETPPTEASASAAAPEPAAPACAAEETMPTSPASTASEVRETEADVQWRVDVVSGPHRGDSCLISADRPLTIGRANDADVALCGDPLVSQRHATLEIASDSIILTDMHSTNGCFVRMTGPCELRDGDEFIIGDNLIQVSKRT